MIVAKNIYKSFENKEILTDISLSISKGDFIALIGPSGTGKSVLLKILAGLEKPSKGSVSYFPIAGEKRIKLNVVFQQPALLDDLPVWENITLGLLENRKIKEKEARQLAAENLRKAGLEDSILDLLPSQLSGGMQKRISIIRAISTQPDFLFYDEPTSGLDPENAGIIDSLILEIYEKTNAATFVVTHDLLTLEKIKPTILVLVDGILTGPMTFSEFTHAQEKGHLSFLNRG